MSEEHLVAQLATLRESLRLADIAASGSLSVVFHSFLDITEGPDLMKRCKPAKNRSIQDTLERVVRRYKRDEALSLAPVRMLAHAPTGFYHGAFVVGGTMGTFFYFLEDKQGLLAFNEGSPMTYYFRVTATELPPGTVLMRRPAGLQ